MRGLFSIWKPIFQYVSSWKDNVPRFLLLQVFSPLRPRLNPIAPFQIFSKIHKDFCNSRRQISSENAGATTSEPEFVNLLRSPGIDSQPGQPASRASTTTHFEVPARHQVTYAGGIDSLDSIYYSSVP